MRQARRVCDEAVVGVGRAQQHAQAGQDGADVECRRPVALGLEVQDVQADQAVRADVGVEHPGRKAHCGARVVTELCQKKTGVALFNLIFLMNAQHSRPPARAQHRSAAQTDSGLVSAM